MHNPLTYTRRQASGFPENSVKEFFVIMIHNKPYKLKIFVLHVYFLRKSA
jgi:hypothetical protein